MQLLRGKTSEALGLAVSPDSRYVAATGFRDTHLWDLCGPRVKAVRVEGNGVQLLEFLSGNRLLMSSNGEWRLYDPGTGRTAAYNLGRGHTSAYGAVSGGEIVLEGSRPEGVKCWRPTGDGETLRREYVWSRPGEFMNGRATLLRPRQPVGRLLVDLRRVERRRNCKAD